MDVFAVAYGVALGLAVIGIAYALYLLATTPRR